ncbi:MAG TPA: hypothetical protein PK390_01435 [Fervidobacterium nodosum]|nr:hypothetical protein [Fervidobacterium nodosum]HOJ93876.1 hypothetical protein [Fervidobacterium nodosum]
MLNLDFHTKIFPDYVLETGRIVLEGTGKDLLEDERVRKAYLGG